MQAHLSHVHVTFNYIWTLTSINSVLHLSRWMVEEIFFLGVGRIFVTKSKIHTPPWKRPFKCACIVLIIVFSCHLLPCAGAKCNWALSLEGSGVVKCSRFSQSLFSPPPCWRSRCGGESFRSLPLNTQLGCCWEGNSLWTLFHFNKGLECIRLSRGLENVFVRVGGMIIHMSSICMMLNVLFRIVTYEMSLVLSQVCLSNVTGWPTHSWTASVVLSGRNNLQSA